MWSAVRQLIGLISSAAKVAVESETATHHNPYFAELHSNGVYGLYGTRFYQISIHTSLLHTCASGVLRYGLVTLWRKSGIILKPADQMNDCLSELFIFTPFLPHFLRYRSTFILLFHFKFHPFPLCVCTKL